ncbi:hypothetical protein VTN96DRAFT_4345 [Rasamsonia emersonii]
MDILSRAASRAASAGPSIALGSALSLAAAAYLNARLCISSDLRTLRDERFFGRKLRQRLAELDDTCTLYRMLERVIEVDGKGDADALWFENRTWTYAQLKDVVDRLAALLHQRGIRTGDFVAVFTTNSPEMVVCIYALAKLGAVAALINTNLRDDTFKHCLTVSTAKLIISTPDLAEFVRSDLPHLTFNLSSFNDLPQSPSIELINEDSLRQVSPSTVSPAKRSPPDLAVLIYTSGTTGNPKACAIRNMQLVVTSTPVRQDAENPSRYFPLRIYSALPLFHGTALFGGLCYSVGTGATLCLRRKFSASRFWQDVHASRATRVLYIGELCRYLLATPPSPYDRGHACIVAYGNGLRGEIWDRFRERFGVPEIREIYRSTEGVARYDNFFSGAWGTGCVGFVGPLRQLVEDDTFIVKYDPDKEMPYRDPKTGFCVKARAGEEGEVIGRVRNRDMLTEYLNNPDATEKKLLRDVFQKGDLFQRMGDLLVRDKDGWVRFQDRVGDTFRWKGENVSAGEVRDHICRIPNVQDAVVYGVKLKGYDGQAGAAGITLERWTPDTETEFMSKLYSALKAKGVPSYALPRLVRITKRVATGVTFKQAKNELAKRGWDPAVDWDGDSLYWLNGTRYERLSPESWRGIESGKAKL